MSPRETLSNLDTQNSHYERQMWLEIIADEDGGESHDI